MLLQGAILIKWKWIFVRNYDANGVLKKYKARLDQKETAKSLEWIILVSSLDL